MVTEHGCESGAYCHTFLYKAHFERERGKALKLGFKQSICGSSERRVEKSFGKGSFLPSVTSRLLPFLYFTGGGMKVLENAQTGRMQQDQLCCSSKQKIRNLSTLSYKPIRGACLSKTSTQTISDNENIGSFWR